MNEKTTHNYECEQAAEHRQWLHVPAHTDIIARSGILFRQA